MVNICSDTSLVQKCVQQYFVGFSQGRKYNCSTENNWYITHISPFGLLLLLF